MEIREKVKAQRRKMERIKKELEKKENWEKEKELKKKDKETGREGAYEKEMARRCSNRVELG